KDPEETRLMAGYDYLKHFRNMEVVKQGHNTGGAVGPLATREKIPKTSTGVKAPKVMPPVKGGKGKVEATMHEFKEGSLHSGSKKGPKVTNRKQAIAIALSQARKAGEKV